MDLNSALHIIKLFDIQQEWNISIFEYLNEL